MKTTRWQKRRVHRSYEAAKRENAGAPWALHTRVREKKKKPASANWLPAARKEIRLARLGLARAQGKERKRAKREKRTEPEKKEWRAGPKEKGKVGREAKLG